MGKQNLVASVHVQHSVMAQPEESPNLQHYCVLVASVFAKDNTQKLLWNLKHFHPHPPPPQPVTDKYEKYLNCFMQTNKNHLALN